MELTILGIVGLDSESEQQAGSGSQRQVQKRAGIEPNTSQAAASFKKESSCS